MKFSHIIFLIFLSGCSYSPLSASDHYSMSCFRIGKDYEIVQNNSRKIPDQQSIGMIDSLPNIDSSDQNACLIKTKIFTFN